MLDEPLSACASSAGAVRVASVGVGLLHVVSALQMHANRHLLRDDSVLGWRVVSLRYQMPASRASERVLRRLFGYPQVMWTVFLRLALAVLVVCSAVLGHSLTAALFGLSCVNAVTVLRIPYGGNAADEMGSLATIALCVGACVDG